MKTHVISGLLCLAGFSLCLSSGVTAAELQVYSSKNASYVKPLFDDYSRETGVAVSYLIAPTADLISRLEIEGAASKADILLATGASLFWSASQKGLFSSVKSRTLKRNVPKHLKSASNDWFSFSKRARTLIYNADTVDADELLGYADLASDKWKGKLCLRTSKAEYTQSLVAMLIERMGEKDAKTMLQGWVSNLAIAPLADDQDIIDSIEEGKCEVGIVNSYYYARLKRAEPDTHLKLFWADQGGKGVHVNTSAVAVTAHSSNKDQAIDFLEWLSTKRTQAQYAKLSMEYPVNKKVRPAREVAEWGRFKEDNSSLENAGIYKRKAVELLKDVKHP